MTEATDSNLKKPLISLIIILVLSVVIDQGTKQWAHYTLLNGEFHARTAEYPVCSDDAQEIRTRRVFINGQRQNIVVFKGFDFRYVENCASAFGLMNKVPESLRFPFFLVISVLALGFIPWLYKKTPPDQKLMLYALPFVLGGAIGNFIDRLVTRYVIDFIRWYVEIGGKMVEWPTFNIADVAIVIGIGLMILQMLPRKENKEIQAKAEVQAVEDATLKAK